MRARRSIGVSMALGMLVAAARVGAQAPPTHQASELIDHAVDLREHGDDVQARELIQRAYALDPTPRAAAQLGLVEQALGLWVEAESHLAEALSHSDDAWIAHHLRALTASRDAVLRNVAQLDVVTNVPGASISIGGAVVGTTPLPSPLHVAAGRVELVVSLDGYQSRTVALTVDPGRLGRQLVELELAPPAPTAPPPVVADHVVAAERLDSPAPPIAPHRELVRGGPTVLWSWALLAAAAVSGGFAIGLGMMTQSTYDGLSRSCGDYGCSDAQISSSGVNGQALATNIFIGVTSALAIATLIAFVVELGSGPHEERTVSLRADGIGLAF